MAPHQVLQRPRRDGAEALRQGHEGRGARAHPLHKVDGQDEIERFSSEIIADAVDFLAWPKRDGAGNQTEGTDDIPF